MSVKCRRSLSLSLSLSLSYSFNRSLQRLQRSSSESSSSLLTYTIKREPFRSKLSSTSSLSPSVYGDNFYTANFNNSTKDFDKFDFIAFFGNRMTASKATELATAHAPHSGVVDWTKFVFGGRPIQ